MAIAKSAKTYDDAVEMVRQEEVFDIVVWYQDENGTDDNPNPLQIAHFLSANLNFYTSTQMLLELK